MSPDERVPFSTPGPDTLPFPPLPLNERMTACYPFTELASVQVCAALPLFALISPLLSDSISPYPFPEPSLNCSVYVFLFARLCPSRDPLAHPHTASLLESLFFLHTFRFSSELPFGVESTTFLSLQGFPQFVTSVLTICFPPAHLFDPRQLTFFLLTWHVTPILSNRI